MFCYCQRKSVAGNRLESEILYPKLFMFIYSGKLVALNRFGPQIQAGEIELTNRGQQRIEKCLFLYNCTY